MTRDQIVLQLQQDYAVRREENQRIFEERVQAACELCTGLRELVTGRQDALMAGIRRGILSDAKNAHANETLSERMAEYNERIGMLLRQNSLSPGALDPVYTCKLCRDEGYVYEPSRRMCSCFEQEMNRRVMEGLGLSKGTQQTFERFKEELFSTETLPSYGVSQRQMMIKNRNTCQAYADSFPNTPARDMLFIGKSGLGKTYLLEALAYRVAERGYLPLYTSAYRLLEVARKAYFENDPEHMAAMMNAPLLLIDDLGTEPLMANITVTQLFNLLNERQLADRHTVISTNLEMSELRERYTERVASRLLDGRNVKRLTFIGDDVRKHLKNGDCS